jgi:DHA1 family bicyclomycin/chloramphenicol resistance-like MFS transporter
VKVAPRSPAYLALLIGLSSFGPLTMSIYTPVMPLIGSDLGAAADSVKYSLTTYMLGFAIGQLFYGPLSDRFGRRPIVLIGVAFFTATSVGCAFASSIEGLIGLRILQGLGAASGAVLGRALLRDAYETKEMPLVMSWIALAMNVSPAIAPSIGGLLGQEFGWRATFWFVAGFGALLLVAMTLALGETNRFRSERIDLAVLRSGSGEMLRNPRFLDYVLTLGFAFAINFGMLAGTPFILQDKLGFSPREFGLIVLISTSGFAAGNFANNRLVGRMQSIAILRLAGWFHVTALTIMAVLSLSGVATWWAIVGPHMVLSFGSGMIGPNASAGAVSLYPRLAGTASSWLGLAQMGMGALGTIMVAVLTAIGSRYTAMPLVIALMPFAIATVLASRLLKVTPSAG